MTPEPKAFALDAEPYGGGVDGQLELDEYLDGPEPDWTTEPEPPPDVDRANALLRRVARIRADRSRDQGIAARQHTQIDEWLERRDYPRQSQERWLLTALERYHRGVIARAPQSLSISLPAGSLISRKPPREWRYTDEAAFLAWAKTNLPAAVRQKPIPDPEIDKAAVKALLDVPDPTDPRSKRHRYGFTPTGERPPGLIVDEHNTPADRTFDIKITGAGDPAEVPYTDTDLTVGSDHHPNPEARSEPA